MAENDVDPVNVPAERVGFKDIYRAVGESESRVKEHVTLIMLPIAQAVADHESRIRSIEREGSKEAREALAATHALGARVTSVEKMVTAGIERRTGSFATLSAQRSFIVLLGIAISIVIGLVNLVERVSTH